jgi:cytoskeletal protein CcmA (bactofilin family)
MPPSAQDKIAVPCPHCGHQQREPRLAISTNCRKCGRHFQVQAALQPAAKARPAVVDVRRVTCFDCATEMTVAASAESTMCKRCSAYIDLRDYRITVTVSKNFKTKGTFIVEPKGYVLNTEVQAGEAVIKGRLLGKIAAESLTLYSSAAIRGSFTAARLIIPEGNHFRWPTPIRVGSAAIAGELAADLRADCVVLLKSSARMFGDIEAANLVVESGAVVVGSVRIGAARAGVHPKAL